MAQSEQFLIQLRSALNHLYDPYFLQHSPLVKLFGLGDEPDTPSALQRIINEGIAALEPKAGDPNQGQSRRNFELIMYRYVQQFGQEEVANQLGVSVRHLRREQNAAVFQLGAILWESCGLGARPLRAVTLELEDLPPALGPDSNTDLDWLKETPFDEPSALDQVLPVVVELTRPLAAKHGVELTYQMENGLPPLALQTVALRQILLNILSVSVACSQNGQLEVSAAPQELDGARSVVIGIRCTACNTIDCPEDQKTSLDIAARMTQLCGGRLDCSFQTGPISARLVIPVFETLDVLVIDDNPDFMQLVQRETTGTRYKVSGTRDPLQGLRLAEEQLPDIILLDVMMPRVDGWEVLGRLRSHPATAPIPVIICTILAQEDLARSLGAKGFLRKPVTRASVLAALDEGLRS